MSDTIPSESELKAAKQIAPLCDSEEITPFRSERIQRLATIIATDTRYKGKTAKEWFTLYMHHKAGMDNEARRAESAEAKCRELAAVNHKLQEYLITYKLDLADAMNGDNERPLNKALQRIATLEAEKRTIQAQVLRWAAYGVMARAENLKPYPRGAVRNVAKLLASQAAAIERGEVTIGGGK